MNFRGDKTVENQRPPAPDTSVSRSERADAITVLIAGLLAVVVVIGLVSLGAVRTLRRDGIGWILPVGGRRVDAPSGSRTMPVHGDAMTALVVAPNVNAVSVTAIVLSHLVYATVALTIVGGALFISWSFLRDRFFTPGTVRALAAISGALAFGPALIFVLDTFGRNGVLAALSIDDAGFFDAGTYWSWLPLFTAGIGLGLITQAFRRSERLQRDTEGLV